MKFLILCVIVLAMVVWFQRLKKNIRRSQSEGVAPLTTDSVGSVLAESMVACTHCKIHFPASEAVVGYSGAVFCSVDHRRLHSA